MPSNHALLTHGFLRTFIRPVAEHVPMPLARLVADNAFRYVAKLYRNVRVERVSAGGVPGEIITPEGAHAERMLYYLHGGGYCVGSLHTHRHLVVALAKRLRVRALHIDYRLAPEHPHPAALEDAVAAYEWLMARGVEPANLVIGGESAGGGLSLATMVTLRNRGAALPALGIILSPWVDLTNSGRSHETRSKTDPLISRNMVNLLARHYHGKHDPEAPLVSPLFADLRGLPPLLIHAGDNEVLRDDAVRLAERCREHGVDTHFKIHDDVFHAFHFFGHMPEARRGVREIARFVEERWGMVAR